MRQALALSLLLAAVAVVHWPPPGAEFSYDDRDFIENNQSLRSLGEAVRALAMPFPPEQPERALYRPVTALSYALDYALFGAHARGFHAVNVALYLAVVVLIERLALSYLGSAGFALSVASLFALHPVHCDAVDSVAGRSEILALLFSLASLLLLLRGTAAARLASAAAYALACLSKETGAVLPGVLAVHLWVRSPPARGAGPSAWLRGLRPLAPHAAVLLAYLLLRSAALGHFTPAAAIFRDSDLVTRLSTMGAIFLVDLYLLVLPSTLQVDFYYQALIGLLPRFTAASLLGWGWPLGLLAWTARLAARQLAEPAGAAARERAVALSALSIFLVMLFPYSHVIDFGALLAERFLFAPSLGFVLLVAWAARRGLARALPAPARSAAAAALVLALSAAGAWRSHQRALEWRDAVALWQSAAQVLHGDVRVHANLGAEYLDRGDLAAARSEIERALAIAPDHLPSLGNLGGLLLEEGRIEEATALYARIAALSPGDFLAWNNLAIAELRRGRNDAAVVHLRHALELNPNSAMVRRNLADAEARAGGGVQGPR